MMFFIHKYSPTTLWRFFPDNSFTRLILLENLSQSMEWTDGPILTVSVLLLFLPWEPSLDTSFCPPFLSLANSPHLLPISWQSTFTSSVSLCLSLSVCVCDCLYVSQPPLHALCLSLPAISLLSAHISYFDKSYLAPSASFSLSLGLLGFFPSFGAVGLYASFVSAVCL